MTIGTGEPHQGVSGLVGDKVLGSKIQTVSIKCVLPEKVPVDLYVLTNTD